MTNRRKEVDLVNSLIEYLGDIKPYHTKLKNSSSEVVLEDNVSVTVTDSHQWEFHHQNSWGADDSGCENFIKISDGSDSDKLFRIPATVFPRFSDDEIVEFSDQLGSDQIPVELSSTTDYEITNVIKDGATYHVTYTITTTVDTSVGTRYGFGSAYTAWLFDRDGTSTSVIPIKTGDVFALTDQSLTFTPSSDEAFLNTLDNNTVATYAVNRRAQVVKIFWTETGRFNVPFHQGSKITVNDVAKTFGTHFLVSNGRTFIQFTKDNHPAPADEIHFNLMRSDRFFVAYNRPFDFDLSSVDASDHFDITVNYAYPSKHQIVSHYPISSDMKSGPSDIEILRDDMTGQIWRITAISHWSFKVQQIAPIVGGVEYAFFKRPFNNGKISFIIDKLWSSYYFTPEASYYSTYASIAANSGEIGSGENPAEAIILFDSSYGSSLYGANAYAGPYTTIEGEDVIESPNSEFVTPLDPTDYLFNLRLQTEHGVIVDPDPDAHTSMKAQPFGLIKKVEESPGKEYYSFQLFEAPSFGTYIELRVEQNGQLNPWAVGNVVDKCVITTIQTSASVEISYTTLRMLDIPIMDDSHNDPGFYVMAKPTENSQWEGTTIFSSGDGSTFDELGSILTQGIFGTATTVLSGWTDAKVLDEINSVTVNVGANGLVSRTQTELLTNPALNAMLIGNEIVQFLNATFVSYGVYDLSGLLRGRRGTEWAMSSHVSNENATLLDLNAMYRVPGTLSELNVQKWWKGVSIGATWRVVSPISFTNTGLGLKPFSPTNISYIYVDVGGTTKRRFTWERRSRLSTGDLDQPTESYSVELLNDAGISLSTTTVNSAVLDTTIFSGTKIKISQLSPVGPGYPENADILVKMMLRLAHSGNVPYEPGYNASVISPDVPGVASVAQQASYPGYVQLTIGAAKATEHPLLDAYLAEAVNYPNIKWVYLYDELGWENDPGNPGQYMYDLDKYLEILPEARKIQAAGLKTSVTILPEVILQPGFTLEFDAFDVIGVDIYPSLGIDWNIGLPMHSNRVLNQLMNSISRLRTLGFKGEIWYVYQAFGSTDDPDLEGSFALQREAIGYAPSLGVTGLLPYGLYDVTGTNFTAPLYAGSGTQVEVWLNQ